MVSADDAVAASPGRHRSTPPTRSRRRRELSGGSDGEARVSFPVTGLLPDLAHVQGLALDQVAVDAIEEVEEPRVERPVDVPGARPVARPDRRSEDGIDAG